MHLPYTYAIYHLRTYAIYVSRGNPRELLRWSLQAVACSGTVAPANTRVAAQTALRVQGVVCAHVQNLKTALTSSLGRFRGSGDGVKNIFPIVLKIWESFSYG